MKLLLLAFLLIVPGLLHAQQFVPLPFPVEGEQMFDGVLASSIAFADIDGDNDQDFLIAGEGTSVIDRKYNPNPYYPITRLYRNDGQGRFAEMKETPFAGVRYGSVAFADIDGDSDQDVMITGQNRSGEGTAQLYLNDGSGRFTEMVPGPFEGVVESSIAFADVDGDSDQDLLITGRKVIVQDRLALSLRYNHIRTDSIDRERVAQLYLNDGKGGFTEAKEVPFEKVHFGSIAFADVDGDSDQDLMITGINAASDPTAHLYLNDGSGRFTEMPEALVAGVYYSSIAFADVDGDSDQDLVIAGVSDPRSNDFKRITSLYLNDGSGEFREAEGKLFEAVSAGSIAFADVDGDSDQDLMVTGGNGRTYHERVAHLYINTDKTPQLLRTLTVTPRYPASLLHVRHFVPVPYPGPGRQRLQGVVESSIAFADVDGDSDQDLMVTGYNSGRMTILYLNNGDGRYTAAQNLPFVGVNQGSIAFADVDGDNDQDLMITGESDKGGISTLYLNDGGGGFTEMPETPFVGVSRSSIAFADVDGDGDQDLMITGMSHDGPIAQLYLNDGKGRFTGAEANPSRLSRLGYSSTFLGVDYSSIAFIDVDGDNDQDLIITGHTTSPLRTGAAMPGEVHHEYTTKLYLNDGKGEFAEVSKTPFEGVSGGAFALGDIDGDGDQDLVITGQSRFGSLTAQLYLNLNDGKGGFAEGRELPFEGALFSSLTFNDVDRDGDQDLIVTGSRYRTSIAELYLNDGKGEFTNAEEPSLEGVENGSIALADVDGDGDQDLAMTGENESYTYNRTIHFYLNISESPAIAKTPFISVGHLATTATLLGREHFALLPFADERKQGFEHIDNSSVAFADVDGDGDQDVVITGEKVENNRRNLITGLHLNNGNGQFTQVQRTSLEGVAYGSVAFADIDGDGDQDLVTTGQDRSDSIRATLYFNDGTGSFTKGRERALTGVTAGAIGFRDLDGDGDQDLLMTGQAFGNYIAKLYFNDGSGEFTEAQGTPFVGVTRSSIAFADVDGDSDQDIMITGTKVLDGRNASEAGLYLNDGKGGFTRKAERLFARREATDFAFGDVDGDGDQDLVIMGEEAAGNDRVPQLILYLNNGGGDFTEVPERPFEGVWNGSLAFTDVDGDGDQDLVVMGIATITGDVVDSKGYLYLNDGSGQFTRADETRLAGLVESTLSFADVDGDSDQDLIITGDKIMSHRYLPQMHLYLNTSKAPAFLAQGRLSASHLPWILIFRTLSPEANASLPYHAEEEGSISITLVDMAGRKLSQHHVDLPAGDNTIIINCSELPSGSYLVEMKHGEVSTWRRILVL